MNSFESNVVSLFEQDRRRLSQIAVAVKGFDGLEIAETIHKIISEWCADRGIKERYVVVFRQKDNIVTLKSALMEVGSHETTD